MIEIVLRDRCIACDKCVEACPTDVFVRGDDGVPLIARQGDCQTCFMCEAYCPVDALYVAPAAHPLPEPPDVTELAERGLLGGYRRQIGWGHGRTPGARRAIGPVLPSTSQAIIS
ncbi:4Fe-4S binding protein [Nonomuraea angiospora]|uniref:NAD-dependent dihydropyrimidine dehydrogenase PreA subunit n=1 Tax=Nonomuraea angiospora TaxID=46172 RepID=A0ABR9MH73_9ACTN|nr:ferredoxin family protein [Nonomuraea angiospora]MBE1592263.1 NAD-dependent dihydropyrimidine dehydrogenase PreA subunit [Nonomuraea angiospora]